MKKTFYNQLIKYSFWSLLCITTNTFSDQQTKVQFGILSPVGPEKTIAQWSPMIEYLNQQIPEYRISLFAFNMLEAKEALQNSAIDFLLTHSGQYVELEKQYSLSPILTINKQWQGQPYSLWGSVIITKAKNPDIYNLSDIKGQRLAAVGEKTFAGYQAAWRELNKIDIDPKTDTSSLIFTGYPHSKPLELLLNNEVDVAILPTGIIEAAIRQGKLKLEDIRVINSQTKDDYPLLHSTMLYPYWPLSKASHTADEITNKILIALLSIPKNHISLKKAKIKGWKHPLNYHSIYQLKKELKLPPYENISAVNLQDIFKQYLPFIALFFLIVLFSLYHMVKAMRVNLVLEQARKEAEEAAIIKTTFLANMSHEIRTPLNAVLGYAQILQNASDIPSQHSNSLKAISSAGNHLLKLINEILDISKIQTGMDNIKKNDFSLFELVNGVVSVLLMKAKEKNIHLISEFSFDQSIIVNGDDGKLRQVLYNILGNAVKFTDTGESIIFRVIEESDQFGFEIEDTGIGIPKDVQKTLFNPFEQGKEGLSKGSTGLGLSIAKSYTKLMGGNLKLESEYGKGTKFTFSLPLKIVSHDTYFAEPAKAIKYKIQEGKHCTALIVDDVEDNRVVLSQILQNAGVTVETANNGQEALDSIARNQPDIIWMDIRMPVMGGVEALAHIRAKWGDIPCIAISASSLDIGRLGIDESGFNHFVPKPFKVPHIFSIMQRELKIDFDGDNLSSPSQQTTSPISQNINSITISSDTYGRLLNAAESHMLTTLKEEVIILKDGTKDERQLADNISKLLMNYDTDGIVSLIKAIKRG